MNDDFIDQFDPPKPPRAEFAAALYQRITQPMKTTTRVRVLRLAALSLAAVALITTVLLLSPSTRAFANSIVQQLVMKKGNVEIQPANDASTASQLAGFSVLVPSYVPDGYTVNNELGEWTVSKSKDSVMAETSYDNQAADGHLSISEQTNAQGMPDPLLQKLADAQDVTVRGQPGKWMSGSGGKSLLAWNENGLTVMISTNTLPEDEVLKVAESLGQ